MDVATNVVDKGKVVSLDEEVLAKQKQLDKGKAIMKADDSGVRKKRKAMPRGNGIVIRKNDDRDDSDSDSETDHGIEMFRSDESDREESLKSFDYLSDGDDEVIQLRKRKSESKRCGDDVNEEDETAETDQNPQSVDQGFTKKETRRYDVGCSDTIIEHEQAMDALMRRLKGASNGLTDPFTIREM